MEDVKNSNDSIGDVIHGARRGEIKIIYCRMDTPYAIQAPICAYPHGRSNPFLRLNTDG